MTQKTANRIAAGALAFGLGWLLASAAHATHNEGPEVGGLGPIKAVCKDAGSMNEIMELIGSVAEPSQEAMQKVAEIHARACVFAPRGALARLTEFVFEGEFVFEEGHVGSYEIWGVDLDDDGKTDAFTFFTFEKPVPEA